MISVNSRFNSELPDILPDDLAAAKWPYTIVPLRATTTLSTCRFVSNVAENRYPVFCLLESMGSIVRINMRVPAGMVIFLPPCGGKETVAGILSNADARVLKKSPWAIVVPNIRPATQTKRLRIFFVSLVMLTSLLQRSVERTQSVDR